MRILPHFVCSGAKFMCLSPLRLMYTVDRAVVYCPSGLAMLCPVFPLQNNQLLPVFSQVVTVWEDGSCSILLGKVQDFFYSF